MLPQQPQHCLIPPLCQASASQSHQPLHPAPSREDARNVGTALSQLCAQEAGLSCQWPRDSPQSLHTPEPLGQIWLSSSSCCLCLVVSSSLSRSYPKSLLLDPKGQLCSDVISRRSRMKSACPGISTHCHPSSSGGQSQWRSPCPGYSKVVNRAGSLCSE